MNDAVLLSWGDAYRRRDYFDSLLYDVLPSLFKSLKASKSTQSFGSSRGRATSQARERPAAVFGTARVQQVPSDRGATFPTSTILTRRGRDSPLTPQKKETVLH